MEPHNAFGRKFPIRDLFGRMLRIVGGFWGSYSEDVWGMSDSFAYSAGGLGVVFTSFLDELVLGMLV